MLDDAGSSDTADHPASASRRASAIAASERAAERVLRRYGGDALADWTQRHRRGLMFAGVMAIVFVLLPLAILVGNGGNTSGDYPESRSARVDAAGPSADEAYDALRSDVTDVARQALVLSTVIESQDIGRTATVANQSHEMFELYLHRLPPVPGDASRSDRQLWSAYADALRHLSDGSQVLIMGLYAGDVRQVRKAKDLSTQGALELEDVNNRVLAH